MVHHVLTERIVSLVALRCSRLGRLETHVVPAEILDVAVHLAEALRAHGRSGSALAGEKTGGERGDRFGFVHCAGSLLADDSAAEATDGTRTGWSDARRRTGRCEHGPAKILFETIRDILPELDHFLGGAAARIDFHHRAAVDHRSREVRAMVKGNRGNGAVLR